MWLVMASTMSWCSGDIVSTLAPSRRQNAASRSTACGSVPSGGVRMHQRFSNSSAKPASGPECSVPATGCAGTKCTLFGRCWPMSRTTEPFTEPTSDTTAPALRCGPNLLGDRAARADRHADDHQIGPLDRLRVGLHHSVGDAKLGHARPRLGRPRGGDDLAHRARGTGGAHDGRADQSGADDGQSVEQRLGHRDAPLAPKNEASASITARFSSSVPMVMRKQSGRPYSSTRRKMMRRSCRNLSASGADLPLPLGKCSRRKFAALGVTPRPSPDSASAMRPRHSSLCSAPCCTQGWSASAATPASMAGPDTLNGPLMRLSAAATSVGQ